MINFEGREAKGLSKGRYDETFAGEDVKNATGTSVIFPINISLIHFVFVLTSVPNVGERFTKT